MNAINFLNFSIINKFFSTFCDWLSEFFQKLHIFTKIIIVSFLVILFLLPGFNSIPPLDRDEARFSQASKQMLEDQNFIVIKFQEELRSKKPIGIYWLQMASASIFGKENISSYRIPNIVASIILVLFFSMFVYNISFRYFDFTIASSLTFSFFSSLIIATLLGFAIELKQAKTDTVLLMLCTIQQLMFWKLYNYGKESWNKYKHHDHIWLTRFFWLTIAFGILIKGPISPLLFVVTLISVCILDRLSEKEWNISWLNLFLWFQGLLIIVITTTPWVYLAWSATDGSLILDAINEDFLNKVKSGQENHWAPFGSHFIFLLLTFWPMVLLSPFAGRAILNWKLDRLTRFLISWLIPFWLILELTPTKLPHYILPIFPALILLILLGISSPPSGHPILKKISKIFRIIVIVFTILLAIAFIYISLRFSSNIVIFLISLFLALMIFSSIICGNNFYLNLNKHKLSPLFGMAIFAGISNLILFSAIIPNLDKIHITPKIVKYINSLDFKPDTIVSTGYHEPSLVFSLGRDTLLLKANETALVLIEGDNTLAIVEDRKLKQVNKTLEKFNRKVESLISIDGYNLAKGQKIILHVLKPTQNQE